MDNDLEDKYNEYREDFQSVSNILCSIMKLLKENKELERNIYKVTERVEGVKSLTSLRKKIPRLAKQKEAKDREKAEKLMNLIDPEKEFNINNLFDLVYDIVGVRVICFHKKNVKKIVEKIEDALKDNQYKIAFKKVCIPRGTTLEKEWKDRGFSEDFRDSGYRSVHIYVKLPEEHGFIKKHKSANAFECEIQVCTLIQYVWAEIDHAIYKLLPKDKKVEDMYHLFSEMLHNCDSFADRIDAMAEESYKNNVRRGVLLPKERYRIQIKDDKLKEVCSEFDLDLEETKNILVKLDKFYKLLEDEEYEKSLKTINALLSEICKESKFYKHVEMEMGYNYIMLGRYDRAREIYRKYTRKSNDKICYFWATFRIAYILAGRDIRDINKAVDFCKKAEKIIIQKKWFSNISKFFETEGLQTNVYLNLSHHYALSAEKYKKNRPKYMRQYENAYENAKKAYKISNNHFKIYALNNLVSVVTDANFTSKFSDFEEEDPVSLAEHANRIFRHTYARLMWKMGEYKIELTNKVGVDENLKDCGKIYIAKAYKIIKEIYIGVRQDETLNDFHKQSIVDDYWEIKERYDKLQEDTIVNIEN